MRETSTYRLSGYWTLSFFVQLGLGNDQNSIELVRDSAVFSLGMDLSPMVTADIDKNDQDRVEISFTQPEQRTLEQAIGVGTEAVRSALETAGISSSAITSVVAVGYGDPETGDVMARYDVTQKAMEIEMMIQRTEELEIDKLDGGLGRT